LVDENHLLLSIDDEILTNAYMALNVTTQ